MHKTCIGKPVAICKWQPWKTSTNYMTVCLFVTLHRRFLKQTRSFVEAQNELRFFSLSLVPRYLSLPNFFCWLAAWRCLYRETPRRLNHFIVITLYQKQHIHYVIHFFYCTTQPPPRPTVAMATVSTPASVEEGSITIYKALFKQHFWGQASGL